MLSSERQHTSARSFQALHSPPSSHPRLTLFSPSSHPLLLSSPQLFANRITKLEGLDTLEKLQVFSVGNNLIAQLDNVMYLRQFTKLQAVNLVGNPFCQEDEYRRYVLAHLKFIKYLDYRLVDEQAVSQAKEQYQDELLDMEETETQAEANAQLAEEKAKRVALHRSAAMKGMDDLFDDLMVKGDGDMTKLRNQQQIAEPMAQNGETVQRRPPKIESTPMKIPRNQIEGFIYFSPI